MKRILLLLLAIVVVSGCIEQKETSDEVIDDTSIVDVPDVVEKPKVETIPASAEKGIALMDRNKYLVGGKENFDTAKAYFTQKRGKGFNIEVDATDKNIEVNVMTDKNCLALDEGRAFEVIETKQGIKVNVIGSESMEENRNICIQVKAIDEGEITAHITVDELNL